MERGLWEKLREAYTFNSLLRDQIRIRLWIYCGDIYFQFSLARSVGLGGQGEKVGYRLSILSCEIRRKFFSWEDPKRQSLSILSCEISWQEIPELAWNSGAFNSLLRDQMSAELFGWANRRIDPFNSLLRDQFMPIPYLCLNINLTFNSLLRDQVVCVGACDSLQ